MNTLSPVELKKKIDGNEAVTIVDLQDAHAYEHRHIPSAINVPITDKCDEACAMILREKDSAIVVYGEFDELGKGSQAAETLEKMGYSNLLRLTGGLMGWMEAGYMIEGGRES